MEDFTQNISHKINYRSATKYFAQTFFNKMENLHVLNDLEVCKSFKSFKNIFLIFLNLVLGD